VGVPNLTLVETPRHPLPPPVSLFGGALLVRAAEVAVTPAPDDRDPMDHKLTLRLEVRQGGLRCVALTVEESNGPPVTTESLRRVAIGSLVCQAADLFDLVLQGMPGIAWQPPETGFAKDGPTDRALMDIVNVWQYETAIGGHPFGVLEREYGVSRSKAARWLATARRRGYVE
jgi:hypothetical protein